MSNNKMGKQCIIHKKICDLYCTFSKCQQKILCEKCTTDHQQVHPKQFIYTIETLCEIHSFDKIKKMKQVLGKYKIQNEQRIARIYDPFTVILQPLINRVKQFERESRTLINNQLLAFLVKNKSIIQSTKIQKSDTKQIKANPQRIIEQAIQQVELINRQEADIKEYTEKYTWYADSTEQLCEKVTEQLQRMINISITMMDTYQKIQNNKFILDESIMEGHHEKSFYQKYINSVQVATRGDKNIKQMQIMQARKEVARKQAQLKRASNANKELTIQITQLKNKIKDLTQQILRWQQKKQRQQKQRRQALQRQKKAQQQHLVKIDVILNGGQAISMQKKNVQEKYMPLIFQLVPNPVQLILSQHTLSRQNLGLFYNLPSLQILRMSFMPCDRNFLAIGLKNYVNLHTLELNTSQIDDLTLNEISPYFPDTLKHLYLIDNKITDDGIENMYKYIKKDGLQSLFISYNELTDRTIIALESRNPSLKTLHISKNDIKSRGAQVLGRVFKQIQELFIGGTQIQKEGFLAICRNCLKLKRLSLVATQVTTEIISQILLGLTKLQWLDVSYTKLTPENMIKINKLRVFNQNLQLVLQK